MNKIIAVVGQAGSGKDTAANYISKKYGYVHVSTADILRDYILKNNLGELTRQNMSKVVEQLRKKEGNDILVRIALGSNNQEKIVLSALRHPEESRLVKSLGGILIDTKADLKIRYKRNSARGRVGDDISIEGFEGIERHENAGGGFDIKKVEEAADYTINNYGSYEDFYSQIDDVMRSIQYK